MKSSRDCVESFWLTHITNFKKQNISIRRYCIENELKSTTFHDWIKKFKTKYPEKFESLHIIQDSKLATDSSDENLFIELQNPLLDQTDFSKKRLETLTIKKLAGPTQKEEVNFSDLLLIRYEDFEFHTS